MQYTTTIEVDAIQNKRSGQYASDGGICRWKAGDWVVTGDGYGPCVFSDEEFKAKFIPCPPAPNPTASDD